MYIAVALLYGLKTKQKALRTDAYVFAAVLLVCILAHRILLENLLHVDFTMKALYSEQTAPFSMAHIAKSMQGMLAYIGFSLLAFGILPAAFLLGGVEDATLTLQTPDGQSFVYAPSANSETQWITANFTLSEPGTPLCVTMENAGGNIYVETYLVE